MAAIRFSLTMVCLLGQTLVEAAVFKQGESAFLRTANTFPHVSFSQMITNNTVVNGVRHELEYELHMNGDVPVKNKVIYVLLAMITGVLGCDRCYMGQVVLGVIKCCTGGCFGIWAFIDSVIAIYSAITMAEDIDLLGFKAKFEQGTVESAYYMCLIILALQVGPAVLQCCLTGCALAGVAAAQSFQDDVVVPKAVSAKNVTKANMPAVVARTFRSYGLISGVPTEEEIDKCFDSMDKDGNGFIDQEELKAMLATKGFQAADADEMFKKADTSQDGQISRDELKAYLKKAAEENATAAA